jgi:hypothetical protein
MFFKKIFFYSNISWKKFKKNLAVLGFELCQPFFCDVLFCLLFFVVLGLKLRAYTLSCSSSPFLWRVFQNRVSQNYLPDLGTLPPATHFNPAVALCPAQGADEHVPLLQDQDVKS